MHPVGQIDDNDAVNRRGGVGLGIRESGNLGTCCQSQEEGQDGGFETPPPKHLENSGENGSSEETKMGWGPHRHQLLPHTNPRDRVTIVPYDPPLGHRTIWGR